MQVHNSFNFASLDLRHLRYFGLGITLIFYRNDSYGVFKKRENKFSFFGLFKG